MEHEIGKIVLNEEIKHYLEQIIRETVNGKIDGISKKLDDYIKDDNEWKKENEPYLQGLENLTGGAKIVLWCAMFVSAVGGAVVMIKQFLKP